MENKKQVGSSSSSFATELFGARDSIAPSSSSKVNFASIFEPTSMVRARNSAWSELTGSLQNQHLADQVWSTKQGTRDNTTKNGENMQNSVTNVEKRSIFQERAEPCPLSSSLYYGGQEDMYIRSSSHQTSNSYHTFKKDEGEDDLNGNVSRGNWWQGSVYY